MPHIEVRPEQAGWVVRYEGDPVPLAKLPTRGEADAEARNHAREFPEPITRVHGLDGELDTTIV